jgi:TetR/AcrR family transcriptional regulator, cholesterol catabolism regulator
LVMYQEAKSLTKDALPYVLKKENEMAAMFEKLITLCVENGELSLTEKQIRILSHTIIVEGQMWSFRRWTLQKLFTLDEYIELQTERLFSGINGMSQNSKKGTITK